MTFKFFILGLFALSCALPIAAAKAQTPQSLEMAYQNDADLIRLEHLLYWTDLVEQYHAKTGTYPFQDKNAAKNAPPLMVRIVTPEQASYMIKGGAKYNPDLDNNGNGFFKEIPVKDFVAELESKLGRVIDEKYDIQNVPTKSPVGYFYFTTPDGYLVWTPCITCGVTKVSTLLMDGFTPTVNIVSEGMVGQVTKALTREEMMANPTFKEWQGKTFFKEGYAREVEQKNAHASKGK